MFNCVFHGVNKICTYIFVYLYKFTLFLISVIKTVVTIVTYIIGINNMSIYRYFQLQYHKYGKNLMLKYPYLKKHKFKLSNYWTELSIPEVI